jgi:hypothetical protein
MYLRRFAPACLSLALMAGFGVTAFGQGITGSIVGAVQDPSGSAIPNAKVTITNTDRNAVIRTATTGADGNYSAPLLPFGHYSVTVEAQGFKKSIKSAIELNVADNLTVDVRLEVGDVQQQVTVEANPVQVELQGATAQGLIEGKQITELSLNARNYEQLVALMPGVTYTDTGDQIWVGTGNPLSGQSNQVRFAINGGRTDQNGWTVDGADNVDRGANLTLLSYPSVDAIAEVRVLRGLYSAENGRNAGGMVNVITKSGTNQFHFSAYEFFRNDKLAANNYFSNQSPTFRNPDGTAKVAPLRYNNFGWNVAGPVYIPRIYKGKNKTFFFFSQEFRRVITYTPVASVLPTANEKKGIFDAPVCVAFTGSTCTESSTTISRIDPVAQAYLKDIFSQIPDAPGPTTPGGIPTHNLNLQFRNIYNLRQESIKVDHQFSEKWLVAGRYGEDKIPTVEPRGLFQGASLPGVSTTSTNSPGKLLTLRLTTNISPALINEAGYNYSYGAVLSYPIGLDATANSPDINLKLPFAVQVGRVPTLSFGGISTLTGFGPYLDYNRNHTWFDTLTKIRGKHTLKAGVTINKYSKEENANGGGQNVGSFTFATTPRPTGSAANATMQGWANFLLGNVSNFTQLSRDITPIIHQNQTEMFLQDGIRLLRNLTLDVGVRYSLFRQPTDANGYLNAFDFAAWDPAKAPQVDAAGNLVPGTGDPLNGQVLAGKTSRYGNKIAPEKYLNFAPRFGLAWDPFRDGKTSIRTGFGLAYDTPAPGLWETPITTNPISTGTQANYSNTTFATITSGTPPGAGQPPSLQALPTDYSTPYVMQWSFDVQRELKGKSIIDVGYYGSGGRHLLGFPDFNQLRPGQAVALGITDANTPLTTTTSPRINAYRPYRGYKFINIYETWFNSDYNSLQVAYKKEFARNGFFGANYTWAKTLTNAGTNAATPQDFFNRSLDRGWSPYDREFVFTANWSYELPFFRKSKGFAKAALGGWQYAGIYSAASGLPFNLTSTASGRDPAGLGILGSQASGRPDLVCDPNADAPHTVAQFFNTKCAVDVPNGVIRPGNAPRNAIRGPGYGKWDMSFMKNFYYMEHMRIQFRAESFNTFNHTNFASIGTALGSTTFGQVTAARDARVIQFGLKLYY